ncbi:MAG: SurA N-terminal domain-containing protein [Pseudomonadota bacterium]
MLNMFRNFTKSRVGLIVVFMVLGVIALAFAAGDVTGLSSAGGSRGKVVAKVGSREILDTELTDEIDRFIRQRRAERQDVTMDQFLQGRGLELIMDQLVDVASLEEFARASGMQADGTLVEGDIVNNPNFHGIDGKFSQAKFDNYLAENRTSAAAYRTRIMRDRYIRWLIVGPAPISQLPTGVLAPYASLELERRTGTVALIRWNDMDPGADPDEKTLAAYYERNKARYMIPPRRILRYALVTPAQFKAQSAATEAEIAEAYAKAGARFAATEKRTVRQLVMLDQAAATAAAAEVKGGKSITDVAKGRGLEPRAFENVEKAALAKDTSPAVAEAAFAAAQGATVGPVRGPLGWVVLHIDTVQKIPAKTLAEAHAELADEISQRKIAAALAGLRQSLEDNIGNGATFDEAMAQSKLTPLRTAALAPNGTDPAVADSKPDAALAPIVQAGFAADPTDQEPLVVAAGPDGSFAVVGVEKAIPATPKPLASIHKEVNRDYLQDITLQKARKAAADVVNLVNKGTPLPQALAATGIRTLLPSKPFDMKRSDLAKDRAPQHLLAFQMSPKRAKLTEAPGRAGYYVVFLDAIEEHDAKSNPALMADAQKFYGAQLRQEAAEQFIEGIKRNVKVTRYPAAIEAVRAELTRQGAR